ncbi:aminoacylase isoform X1 [Bombyx mori]|uniref:N-acyl-aliphatic-L-amino acid amidohydrolase n=1 Tax=Bombyx mori TaxID=7091 RepID=A0A8R2AST7_BOMMO|nr:aminoacylase isoform X1 [Bombyx mori]
MFNLKRRTSGKIDPSVSTLQNYLRIRSVHPNVDYNECINFLKNEAEKIGLQVQVVEPLPKKPTLVMTWLGEQPELPSILLNSHMDVVPVFENSWKHPPFAAEIEDNVIYARGVQDMKSVGIQYIEAVRRLKETGVKLKRTVHLSFVPDEEIGGDTGMGKFVQTDVFKNMNVGFALDEGVASSNDDYLVFNGERIIWHVKITCPGKSGHGSLLLPDNCGEKLRYIIDKFMDLRQESVKKLADNPQLTIGDVTSVNLTMISGGIQNNVVPEQFTANFDLRIALNVDLKEFENMIQKWCTEAGRGVTYEFKQKDPYTTPTQLDDANIYWKAFKQTARELGMSIKPQTFTGGTDSRYLRELGIPALGFSPIHNTTPALHEHNEHLGLDVFINGIAVYQSIIRAVANA